MANTKKRSAKSEFWEAHVLAWKRGKLTQSEYCIQNKLSESSFSKWKAKLLPNLRGARKTRKPKNKYYKHSKLSNAQVETLFAAFLCDIPVKDIAKKLAISEASAYKYYDLIRLDLIDGALNYPQLFFGAGMLLTLGAPPDVDKLAKRFRHTNPSIKGRENLIYHAIGNVLVCHSLRKWSIAETYYFWFQGLRMYFLKHYSENHGLVEEDWNFELAIQMQNEVSIMKLTVTAWLDWIRGGDKAAQFSSDVWEAIRDQHDYHTDAQYWFSTMLQDLKWVVERKQSSKRNTYWDFFKPNKADFLEVNERIHKYLQNKENTT
ncbi:hypothetical protein NBRC116494_06450 [Aurantivibrio plasticivorans]